MFSWHPSPKEFNSKITTFFLRKRNFLNGKKIPSCLHYVVCTVYFYQVRRIKNNLIESFWKILRRDALPLTYFTMFHT